MESIVIDLLKKQGEKLSAIEDRLTLSKAVLNIDEVSKLTGLSKSTIYKFTHTGRIPFYKQAKHLYFDRVEIEEDWLKANRFKTTDELEKEAATFVTIKKRGI